MQKKGELSRLAVNLLVGSLIIILGVIIWIILRGGSSGNQEIFSDENIDLKISQIKKINDNTLDLTLKRETGEGDFVGLSFAVSDGSLTEVVRVNTSMPENQTGNFSLNFVLLNASKIKKISVTPIYVNEEGVEVIGNVKDEYVTPNTCSNYCPVGAQCGYNDCGMQCGNGCGSGYLCLNYKCIKQKTSSGGGGSGGSSGGSTEDNEDETCTDTCASLVKQCGTQTICEESVNCGTCSSGYVCSSGLCIQNNTCIPTTCSALGRTCGTASNGCEGNLNCGSCTTGFTCQTNGTCIKDVIINCNGVSCKSGEYCSNGACLLNVTGKTYFVATNGNDAWSGNFTHPWKTWGKAFTSPSPGDIVYFRGGIYPMTVTNGNGYMSINDGTASNVIYYWAYPTDFASGNVPILDCENITPTGDLNHGIYATADYAHFKGLTVRNVYQFDAADEAFGWRIGGLNTTLELCTAYNIHGVGFRASTNATNMRFINCDAYNIVDYLDEAPLPGNDGYGFQSQNTQTTTGSVYYSGCRAWNCSDDGFTLFSRSYVEVDNCWSFSNGALQGAGNGWKLGFLPDGGTYPALTRKVTNSIAAYNRATGFTSNDNDNEAVTMQLYNNLVYHNGYSTGYPGISPGFYLYNTAYPDTEELKRVLKNNLAYDNEDGPVRIADGALYTHDHNSWDLSVNVTDEDFVLLPETQEQGFAILSAPRKADGSLPDLGNYFKIVAESDLIDKGVNVGLPYSGNAPDLGPFESDYSGSSCNCKSGEYCSNGACLLNVSGNTYFVATNGNDAWSGNFTHPWKTWSKAFHTARPGDIVYFRGGTYYTEVTDGRGIRYIPDSGLGYDGTEQNLIRYFNYPGEIPILDCAGSTATYDDVYNYGLFLHGVDYVHIKGLQIKNVKQRPSPLGEQADVCVGIWNNYCNHLKLENMDIGNVEGYAFRTVRSYYVEVINCDAHDCIDFYHETLPGQWGGGFGGGNGEFEDGYVYYYGCRAWNCSDQGMCASGSRSLVVFDNCWSFNNGALKGGGIGWKIGYWSKASNADPVAIVKNCIAANNLGEGFTGNENTETYAEPYYLYNNFAYNSGRFGFSLYNSNSSNAEELKRIARNNIAYIYGTSGFGFDCYAEPYNPASLYTHSNNSWDMNVNVTNDDFVSLDTSQLMRPRKADGSLPDITFGHLKAGSDLIDKGFNVGIGYSGSAPDLGVFESNY